MAVTITWETLRELAGFRSEKGCAISLYVDLDPSTAPTARDAETRVRSLLAEAEKRLDTRNYGHDNLWRVLPLADSVRDEIRLGRDLYLAPLVPLVGRGDGALVAFVSRERGQVFRLRGGRLEEVIDHSEEQPGQHDQGGWSQARYQR